MLDDPRSDIVADQYSRWVYPAPIEDLPNWLASNWQWFDPSHSHRLLWPDRAYRPDMRILVAGCGTSQAAVLAYTNPSASVTAIDVSRQSLDHHDHLKSKYGLDNLELHQLPIERAEELPGEFDLIVSTGVLHHLADPDAGARVLAGLLAVDGVLAVMLYARYGRVGVEMLQSAFKSMELRQDEASLDIVRRSLTAVPADHPVRAYMAMAPDLDYDAGLVDTFLHGRDRSYTVEDCLGLVKSAGLVFQDWFLRAPYEPYWLQDDLLVTTIAALPDVQRWSVVERMNSRNGRHFFTACRPDRSPSDYRVSLDPQDWDRHVPLLRYRCQVQEDVIVRPSGVIHLTPEQRPIAQLIDGSRSVQDILDDVTGSAALPAISPAETASLVVTVLDSLWKQDALTFALR